MWHVRFAQEKNQTMTILRFPAASQAVAEGLRFEGCDLHTLGTHQDPGGDEVLTYDRHVVALARQASLQVSDFRKIARNLDSQGILAQ